MVPTVACLQRLCNQRRRQYGDQLRSAALDADEGSRWLLLDWRTPRAWYSARVTHRKLSGDVGGKGSAAELAVSALHTAQYHA